MRNVLNSSSCEGWFLQVDSHQCQERVINDIGFCVPNYEIIKSLSVSGKDSTSSMPNLLYPSQNVVCIAKPLHPLLSLVTQTPNASYHIQKMCQMQCPH